ncbi:DUF3325 domain-containing protein [Thalassomonas actiniarum]|uniref:DUF3325 domain-containing protein n=1 Tax=Thalassomonas actiniarum TaxID=485447 RepID=A0AAF0C4Y8_9GAMM|nr:DUF3325 domain-containing protein [Thalassomonas actiniarum]WDE00315.1 DUF3325 domain-containing protein [Thalassomonas actiniarum]
MLFSFLIQAIAIAMLALGMNKHFKNVFNLPVKPLYSKGLKLMGWLLLVFSYYLAVSVLGAPMATVYWLLLLPLSIFYMALVAN